MYTFNPFWLVLNKCKLSILKIESKVSLMLLKSVQTIFMIFLTNGSGFASQLFAIQEITKNMSQTICSDTENYVTNFDVEGFTGTKSYLQKITHQILKLTYWQKIDFYLTL